MKAKRFILMMLVMLGSVTGAWAQEPEEVFLKLTAMDAKPYGLQESEYTRAFDGNNTIIWYDLYTDDMYLEFRTDIPQKVDAYYITTGTNTLNGDRNPYGWILKGKTSRTDEWEVLSTVAESNDNLSLENTMRSAAFPITRSEGKEYMYFRFEFTSKRSTNTFMIGEFEMVKYCTHQYSNDPESGAAYYTCSECGTIAPDRVPGGHVHDYAWAYDTEGHWHQCTFPYGECDAPTNDEKAAHTFNATYTLKCDVCGYVASHTHDYDTEGICKQCGAENPCNHTFNAINDVCDKCGHGFLFYEGTELVQPTGLSILSNSFNDGKGVIETSGPIRGIPDRAFFNCRGLTSITIGNSVETIGGEAFFICTKLNNIFISCSVKSIGSQAFSTFIRGTLEVMWHNPIPFSDMQFGSIPVPGIIQLKVPSTAVENYRDADGWKDCIISTRSHSHTYGNDPSNATAYCTCKTCGYQEHRHAYSTEWSTDATHHWHECTMNFDTCNARQKDKTAHNIHENLLSDEGNYHCDVCDYVDEAKKAQFDSRDYFSLKAVDGDVTLGMSKTGTPDNCVLQVSEDGKSWSAPMTVSETTENIATIPSGETRYFRRGSFTAADKISDDADNCWTFTMSSPSANAAIVEANGNMMSLLDMTCQQSTVGSEAAFLYLFKGCSYLKSVTIKTPVLLTCGPLRDIYGTKVTQYVIDTDITSIGDGLFQNTAITSMTIPEGVTHIGNGAFQSCSALTSIEIPSTVTSIGSNAFARCQNIIEFTLNCPSSCTFGSGALGGANSYKIIVPALTTHSWTSNSSIWDNYKSHFTEPDFTLHANADPDGSGYYTTFYNSHYAYTLPSGVKAYTAQIADEEGVKVVKLTAIDGNILPMGTAVLLHSTSTGEMLMTISEENGNEPGTNLFNGVDADTDQGNSRNYMLSYGQHGLGFYQMKEDMKLSANKAFLPQSAPMAQARALRMVFEDDVTGIANVNDGSANSPTGIYSLSGIHLKKLQKGINIVNGKKIIVK